jgi:hypothetical protein
MALTSVESSCLEREVAPGAFGQMRPYLIQLSGDLKWNVLDALVRQIQLCITARGASFVPFLVQASHENDQAIADESQKLIGR